MTHPLYAIICARTGDEFAARYHEHSDAAEILRTGWGLLHPAAEVVDAPRTLPRRGGR